MEPEKCESSLLGDVLGVRKRVSIVWSYFEKLSREKVRCKLCKHEQNYSGTTGNILRHLRNRHEIDATIKGQNEAPGSGVMKSMIPEAEGHKESNDAKNGGEAKIECATITKTRRRGPLCTKTVSKEEAEYDGDPYAENPIRFTEYIATNELNDGGAQGKLNVQEERLRAEIEYLREKAAYYRMQKNLTALQAKKLKYELDQFN